MRALWTGLLLLIVLGAAFGPTVLAPSPAPDETLVLLSPHWDGIREEFGRAFEEDWLAKTGRRLKVEWWDVGGTGEIKRYIQERAKSARWEEGEGIGVDVLFGGGVDQFKTFAKAGLLDKYAPPSETAREIPAQACGQPLRDAEGRWHAACLSGFGIVYNRKVVEWTGLPVPATWADLGRPEYFGWISCGDPTRSGSLHMVFEIILQAYGWEKGWAALTRMTANVRAFNEGGASIPRDVSLGQCAAGPCLDFYAAAPVRRQGATHLEFVFPEGLSVITPDAIGLFRNGPHPQAARAFLDFVLSEDGQRLWYQTRGSPRGPQNFDLERLPVWKRLYEMDLPTHTVARPFSQAQALIFDDKKSGLRWTLLEELLRGTILDVHEDLKAAWEAAIRSGRGELREALVHVPLAEQELFDLAARKPSRKDMNELRLRWTEGARERYRAIVAAAASGGQAP